MARYERFEQLPVWQEAARLYNRVLDLLEEPGVPLSSAYRNQLERAALSVSNNIAEGFERMTTSELESFIAIARGSAGEVRSMLAVVKGRDRLKGYRDRLEEIERLADSCVRQLNGWGGAVRLGAVQGKRRLGKDEKKSKAVFDAARESRLKWLRGLKAEHPLYGSSEAREARGEVEGE
jgi:four helix bundle protein